MWPTVWINRNAARRHHKGGSGASSFKAQRGLHRSQCEWKRAYLLHVIVGYQANGLFLVLTRRSFLGLPPVILGTLLQHVYQLSLLNRKLVISLRVIIVESGTDGDKSHDGLKGFWGQALVELMRYGKSSRLAVKHAREETWLLGSRRALAGRTKNWSGGLLDKSVGVIVI